jgi:ABC-type transport system involved in multi-copper enzyme maturation permease subunit
MTFLPIIGRELRVAARRRGTHWVRPLVALIAMLVGAAIFVINAGAPQQKLGQFIFQGISILCMVYCLLSGRISTADCISGEKREGTLGLLFLTDLNGYDVVLGKLVATSLGGFYGLLAVLPVMALPLLFGGVASGEFWRMVIVLLDTFLFSLAIGIFGSTISSDARRAMAANFALALLLMGDCPSARPFSNC